MTAGRHPLTGELLARYLPSRPVVRTTPRGHMMMTSTESTVVHPPLAVHQHNTALANYVVTRTTSLFYVDRCNILPSVPKADVFVLAHKFTDDTRLTTCVTSTNTVTN